MSHCYYPTGISRDEALVNKGKGGGYMDSQLFFKETEKVCRMWVEYQKYMYYLMN